MSKAPAPARPESWKVGEIHVEKNVIWIWAGSEFVPLASDTGARIWNDILGRLRVLEEHVTIRQERRGDFGEAGGLGGMR